MRSTEQPGLIPTRRGHPRASWMHSDIVWAGSLHNRCRITMDVMASAARTVQPETDVTWAAKPIEQSAKIQAAATASLAYVNLMR